MLHLVSIWTLIFGRGDAAFIISPAATASHALISGYLRASSSIARSIPMVSGTPADARWSMIETAILDDSAPAGFIIISALR